jgi:hypothetical protein
MDQTSVEAIAREILQSSGSSLERASLSSGVWTVVYRHPRYGQLQAQAQDSADEAKFRAAISNQIGLGLANVGPDVEVERARPRRRH